MTTLLILTTGQSDVQLMIDGVRRELRKDCCGELHDELAKREFAIVDAPAQKGNPIEVLPGGTLSLCTPKVDAVLRFFDEAQPAAAVVFETRRTLKSDPHFAGAVLERRLKERGVRVRRHTFLQGEERLEEPTSDIDAVVRRAVVTGISEVVAEEIDATKPERIFVAAIGGLEAANDVVEELVRLHAVGGSRVTSLEVPDGALTAQADRAVEEKFHPAAGYRARWHALSLIEKGNLLGAWGAVSHLESEPGQEWAQVIKWLGRFASSLPLPEGCDLSVLSHPRMAVRTALRVELALRAGDVPKAVHGTVAFLEAALWDHLLEYFERDPDDARLLKLRDGSTAPTGKLLRDGGDDDKNRPFESKVRPDGQAWYWFHESGGGRFARDYVQSQPLKSLLDAVDKIKALRNDVAHNEPTPALMDDARRRMQAASLWSASDTFLSQPLVQAVLRELGEQNPDCLCINLVSAIRTRVRLIDS